MRNAGLDEAQAGIKIAGRNINADDTNLMAESEEELMPFPSSGDLPNPGIEPKSPTWQEDALSSEPPGNTEKGKAIQFSIFAWRIPWTEEPGRLYSPWGCKSQTRLND